MGRTSSRACKSLFGNPLTLRSSAQSDPPALRRGRVETGLDGQKLEDEHAPYPR